MDLFDGHAETIAELPHVRTLAHRESRLDLPGVQCHWTLETFWYMPDSTVGLHGAAYVNRPTSPTGTRNWVPCSYAA